jgi:hypothetical protein
MSSSDAVSSYVLTLGLLTVFVLVWVTRQHKTKQDATIWLISGVVGLLLGAAGVAAGVLAMGYQIKEPVVVAKASGDGAAPTGGGMASPPGTGNSAGPPAGMMGMGGMGGGMMGMGGGGGRGPQPKQQLTTLVRKLELLTGDITLTLTDEQKEKLARQLDEFAELKTLSDEEAEQRYNDLLGLFDDTQKAKQDAIGLPFRRGGGGGGGGFGGGFGGGGNQPNPNANPFENESNATALQSLRDRLKNPATK